MTDYTKECPICEIGDVEEAQTKSRVYRCCCSYCGSVWNAEPNVLAWDLIQDNSDGLAPESLSNDPYKIYKYWRC